ncbi:hypothetical protein OG500_03435 [Kitasatospora sp. NBC_01250]|uniref:hypothetical protein n=1 Tax=Kitasatospora sp. NBC_01250 TaxID=2903571 RepID=UPI002E2FA440|nr:hypothetical protein [Kitasatospora sp. NBC_01250]
MTAENDQPVYTRAAHAPWREILRQRWSGRRDRALVLRDRDGVHQLLGKRRRPPAAEDFEAGPATAATGRFGLRGYDGAYLVQLDERPGTRIVTFPTQYGAEALDLHLLWWVHDPVQVVQTRTVRGWYPVRKDLDRRLRHLKDQYAAAGHGFGASEMMQYLAAPHRMPDCGLSYRITDVSERESETELRLGEPDGAGPPFAWTDKSREEYDFCQRAVREGPLELAGLWLARHPEEVNKVLNWAVDHADLLRGSTTWQDSVAGLLGKLTEQERQELSRLLRDRLVALGRSVPGPQGRGVEFEKIRSQANGWAGGVVNGRSA